MNFINKLEVNPKESTTLSEGTQNKSYIPVSNCVSAIFNTSKTRAHDRKNKTVINQRRKQLLGYLNK